MIERFKVGDWCVPPPYLSADPVRICQMIDGAEIWMETIPGSIRGTEFEQNYRECEAGRPYLWIGNQGDGVHTSFYAWVDAADCLTIEEAMSVWKSEMQMLDSKLKAAKTGIGAREAKSERPVKNIPMLLRLQW